MAANAESPILTSAKSTFVRVRLEAPMPITLSASSDLEMLKRKVIKRLEERRAKIPQLEALKARLSADARASKSQFEIERNEAEIGAIDKAVELVASGREVASFEEEVALLQLDYSKIYPNAGVLTFDDFGAAGAPPGQLAGAAETARKIVMEFADVAEKYCPLDVQYVFSQGVRVCACGGALSKCDDVCPNCLFPVSREQSAAPDHKDTDNEARENFKREFYRYQGLIHNQIPPDLYDQLDAHFLKNRIPSGRMVRERFKLTGPDGNYLRKRKGKNANGEVIETSVKMMIEALRKTGNPGYYCDVHYICQEYWGWQLPDLRSLEDTILNHDYNAVQVEYNRLMRTVDGKRNPRFSHFGQRKSNVSCRFRLYYHLRARGHICSEQDFKLVTLDHLQMEYRTLLREVFYNAAIPLPDD